MKQSISPRHLKNLQRLSRLSGGVNIAVGILVLLAWKLDWQRGKSIASNLPAMTPNTAISLVALGIVTAFGMSRGQNRRQNLVTILSAAALFAIGISAVWEHLIPNQHLWINHVLMDSFIPAEISLPGGQKKFPAASTGACLVLISVSLLLLKRRRRLANFIFGVAGLIVLAAVFGQTFRFIFPIFQGTRLTISGIAPETAIGLILAILGILASQPRSGFVSRLISNTPAGEVLRIFSLSILSIPLLLTLASFASVDLSAEKSDYIHSALVASFAMVFLTATFFAIRALELSEGRFYQLMEQAGDGILLADIKGNLTDVNTSAREMLGSSSGEDLLGKNLIELFPPESASQLDAIRFDLLKPSTVYRGEWQVKRLDGKQILVEACSRILKGGIWLASIRDISERKKNEERLLFFSHSSQILAEALDYQDIIQKIAELVVPQIADYCVVYTKEQGELQISATAHVAPSQRELLMKTAKDFPSILALQINNSAVATDTLTRYETVTEDTYRTISLNDDHFQRLKEIGTHSYVAAPLVARNRTIGTISMGITGTTRKFTAEDEDFLKEIVRRFALSLDNARLFRDTKTAVRAREDILAVVSHDLKNPLAAADLTIQLAIKKLSSGSPPETIREYLQKIRHSTQRMKRLIDLLLNFGKLQAGSFTVSKGPVRLKDLFKDAEEMFAPIAERAAISLEFKKAEDIVFSGDFDALSQALANLIGNAIKFSSPHSKVAVRIEIDHLGGEVRISVEDQGPGIPEDLQANLFERYWRPKNTAQEGAGLGLYIARGVVRAHGGDISVASKLGKGSTFSIKLPGAYLYTESIQSAS
ncbi:MAG: ATP-binding protein [Bdellovibrionota bacterium]